jgi:hypothetical protein
MTRRQIQRQPPAPSSSAPGGAGGPADIVHNLLIGPIARRKNFPAPLGKRIGNRYENRSGLTARCDPE